MNEKNTPYKILFAVGGTGGHLFPAQALAEELFALNPSFDILFAGAHLQTTHFLNRERYRHAEVKSATPFGRNPLRAAYLLARGIQESLSLLKREKPALIVGFGSYHSFPLLVAAKLRRIPLILFEPNTFPGFVNRLFSRLPLHPFLLQLAL